MGISNIFNIEDLTLCSNPDDVIASDACLPPAPHLTEEIEDVTIIKLFLLEEGAIRSISSNGGAYHFQIAHGSQIRSSSSCIKTFMRSFMPLTRQGRVFLSQG